MIFPSKKAKRRYEKTKKLANKKEQQELQNRIYNPKSLQDGMKAIELLNKLERSK